MKKQKLLILGANAETIPIVKKVQEMGIIAIVTDHIPNSPAKLIADNYYDINGKDVEAIVDVIKKNNIDGVMVGVADPLVSSYVKICKIMNFPCLVSADSISFFSSKKVFRNECKKHGLPVVREYFSCKDMEQIDKESIKYPMVVKPAVSRGGKGLLYCESPDELEDAFMIARNNSDNSEVIGEEYIDSQDAVATFLCINGKTHFLAMSDRIMLKGESKLATVTYSNTFPSSSTEIFKENYLDKYSELFRSLKINNGIVNIQMFCRNGEFIPYDQDCIINGAGASKLFHGILGVDVIGNFVNYALTGDSCCLQYKSDNDDVCMGALVWILLKPGVIGKVEGIQDIEDVRGVLDCLQRLYEGDEVTEGQFETEKSVFARIWIKADTSDELEYLVRMIRERIRVFDMHGQDMIWEGKLKNLKLNIKH